MDKKTKEMLFFFIGALIAYVAHIFDGRLGILFSLFILFLIKFLEDDADPTPLFLSFIYFYICFSP